MLIPTPNNLILVGQDNSQTNNFVTQTIINFKYFLLVVNFLIAQVGKMNVNFSPICINLYLFVLILINLY